MSGLVLPDRLDEGLRSHLNAEVDHLEAGSFEEDVGEVLPDVVHVPLDGAHHERADGLGAGRHEEWPQELEGACHRATRDEHLRHEEVASLEPRTDLLERGDQRLEQHRLRGEAGLDAVLGQRHDLRPVADERVVIQPLQDLVSVHVSRSPGRCGKRRASRTGQWGQLRRLVSMRQTGAAAVYWNSRAAAVTASIAPGLASKICPVVRRM